MDLQKASMWKRISAWILDAMLMVCLAVGIGLLLSAATGYDGHYDTLQQHFDEYKLRYSQQYGVDFSITTEDYEALTAQQQQTWQDANKAMNAAMNDDAEVLGLYNLVANLSLLVTSLGILGSMLVLEFVIPLFLRNGQTLGKKMFNLGVMRIDSVQVSAVQMFVRTLIGKYTIATMIPVFLVIMFLFGAMNITGTLVILAIWITQIVMMAVTHNNSAIHDMLAGTVVVDISSQQIFRSSEELMNYTKRIHAERASRQTY